MCREIQSADSAGALETDRDLADVESEHDLVRAARAEPAAFGHLYERYHTRLYRYMRTRSDTAEDAADLTHQVFARALAALPGYDDRGLPFGAWLFRIARNATADARRRKREMIAWEFVPEAMQPASREEEPEDQVIRRETARRLNGLIAALPPDKREMLTLYFVGRLTLREVGLVVGKREDAVQKQLSRTIRILKEGYSDG